MPREIVLGNGELLVNLDKDLYIRDIYYPYVGWANHVGGYRCRVGVWTEAGGLDWFGDPGWERDIRYKADTLETECVFRHAGQRLRLSINHTVLFDKNVFLQRIQVESLSDEEREVRVFLAQDLRIDESDIGDTAFYHPWLDAMVHYKRERYFLFGGIVKDGVPEAGQGIWQYACGEKGFRGAEGTWRDAEDGLLFMNAIAQGSVDSVVSYRLTVPARGTGILQTWMAAHESLAEVGGLQTALNEHDFEKSMNATSAHWEQYTRSAVEKLMGPDRLPSSVLELYRRSLLIIRTQSDRRGAILASNDSDIMETARAHYSYMWPRDGALVSLAMDHTGHREISRAFFDFCARVLPAERAALMHKYGPDGSLGASWHPWVVDGHPEIPFQEDGTALVVWALWQHCRRNQDLGYMTSNYRRLVRPAVQFLMDFRDPATSLPLPSWDIWEERRGVHLWTTVSVIAAMDAASQMAHQLGDQRMSGSLHSAAELTKKAMLRYFWDENEERFARMVTVSADGEIVRDMTVDSSAAALFNFGVLQPDDPKVVATMETMGRDLWVKAGAGGLARYEKDNYFRMTDDFSKVPGNPWIICTLWLADWYVATAKSESDLRGALELLEWACRCASDTGILAEQVHPNTLEPLSVAPLTWSHAQFIWTVSRYLEKLDKFCPPTGAR